MAKRILFPTLIEHRRERRSRRVARLQKKFGSFERNRPKEGVLHGDSPKPS